MRYTGYVSKDQISMTTTTDAKSFQAALELSLDGFGILNCREQEEALDFTWEYLNPAAARMLKVPAEKALGRPLLETLPASAESGLLTDLSRVFRTGESLDAEIAYRAGRLSGWFRIMAVKLEEGVAVFLRDITEKKLWEESLKQSEARFRVITQSNMIGLLFWDEKGRILDINEALAGIIGFSREEFLSQERTLRDLTPAEFRDSEEKAIAEMKAKGACKPFEKEIYHRDGRPIPVLWGAARLEAINYEGVAFVVDMSEKREMEKQREILLGHELKTPLANIKGFAQLLTSRLKKDNDEKTLAYLSRIDSKVDDLSQLISDLTDLSRIRSGKLEWREEVFDFDQLVKEVAADCRSISETHRVLLRGKTGRIIRADRARISQVLANLLSNAIKYSPRAERVMVHLSSERARITVKVQDFGFGIPPEDQEKIFQPFFRSGFSKNEVSGVGLGLYISSQILAHYRGRLGVESEAGKGSTFYLSLPFSRAAA